MYKKTMIAAGIAVLVATLPTMVIAEEDENLFGDFEVSGELKNETAVFTKSGNTIGAASTITEAASASAHDNGDVMKSETSARLFINGAVGENSELHAELRPVYDGEAVDGTKGHDDYTQQDWLRELYIDTVAGGEDEVSIRAGKQQVVWGTADGMKLLDIINPTDYREMAQNVIDESRIPVWMVNGEVDLENGANVQGVIYQPRENVFAGLNRDISTGFRSNAAVTSLSYTGDVVASGHERGSPFVMKGVDSITGAVHGFANITPDLGSVATMFGMAFGTGADKAGLDPTNHAAMNYFTVGSFNTSATNLKSFSGLYNSMVASGTDATALALNGASTTISYDGFEDLAFGTTDFWTYNSSGTQVAATDTTAGTGQTGQSALAGFASMFATNLHNTGSTTDSTFEYMDRTPFSTFDAFVDATSEYKFDMPSDLDLNLGARYKNTLDNGLTYSMNYAYAYDKNPIINLSWRNASGNEIYACRNLDAGSGNTYLTLEDNADCSGSAAYGGAAGGSGADKNATLRYEQTVERAHNLGSAMDYAIDTESLGSVVLRGEFLYQKDVYSPVMDRGALSIGDLTKALTMRKGDRFKYVLGADVTILTNMMVSGQFIQDRNLDHVDQNVDFDGSTACATVNCGVYTADYATMHLTNGFNKAEENKEFYSLFLSKPFGGEQQHRWNNIFMFEENGGKWNRFDVEYSFNDELIGTFEYDKYWGDANTQFGQLEASSNATLGLKYIF